MMALPELGIPFFYKAPRLQGADRDGLELGRPYVGVNVGYSLGKSKTDTAFSDPSAEPPLFAAGSSDSLNGLIGGVQGGYNWMAEQLGLAGIEADIQLSAQNTKPTFICPGAICNPASSAYPRPPVAAQSRPRQKLDWFGTVRGRLGATVTPDTMTYRHRRPGRRRDHDRRHGLRVSVDSSGNPNLTPVGSASTTIGRKRDGPRAPASKRISPATHRQDRVPLSRFRHGLDRARAGTNSTPIAVNFDSRVTDHIVRLGLNYKFDPNDVWPGF